MLCCVTKTKHPPTLTSELHLRKKKINSSSGRNNILDLTLYVSCRTGLLVFVHTVPRCFSTWSCLWPFTEQIIYGWTTPRVETEQTNHELIWIWHISSYTCTPFTIILTKINTFLQYFFFFCREFWKLGRKRVFCSCLFSPYRLSAAETTPLSCKLYDIILLGIIYLCVPVCLSSTIRADKDNLNPEPWLLNY